MKTVVSVFLMMGLFSYPAYPEGNGGDSGGGDRGGKSISMSRAEDKGLNQPSAPRGSDSRSHAPSGKHDGKGIGLISVDNFEGHIAPGSKGNSGKTFGRDRSRDRDKGKGSNKGENNGNGGGRGVGASSRGDSGGGHPYGR